MLVFRISKPAYKPTTTPLQSFANNAVGSQVGSSATRFPRLLSCSTAFASGETVVPFGENFQVPKTALTFSSLS
jgi:hypothetical protein